MFIPFFNFYRLNKRRIALHPLMVNETNQMFFWLALASTNKARLGLGVQGLVFEEGLLYVVVPIATSYSSLCSLLPELATV